MCYEREKVMIKWIITFLVSVIFVLDAHAQVLQDVLSQVDRNNPEITAYRKLLESRRYEARTGNTPPDPFFSAGILPGNSGTEGSKRGWSINQSFSFPTKYLLQKKINNNTVLLAEQEFNQGRLSILLEAKLAWYDLIYKSRVLQLLSSRKIGYDRLQSAWKKMLENGETTVMDYNRILIELSALNLELNRTKADIRMLHEGLRFLAGSDIKVPETVEYPLVEEPDIDVILKEKASAHPLYLIPVLEYEISRQEVSLSKSGSLPELELGVESEIEPGGTFTGPTGGISIPLWSNSNKIKAATARSEYVAAQRDATIMNLDLEVRNEFSHMKALQMNIEELTGVLEEGGGANYLDTALEEGEISVTTYFSYLQSVFESEERLLELRNEFHKSLARLLDHNLARVSPDF